MYASSSFFPIEALSPSIHAGCTSSVQLTGAGGLKKTLRGMWRGELFSDFFVLISTNEKREFSRLFNGQIFRKKFTPTPPFYLLYKNVDSESQI